METIQESKHEWFQEGNLLYTRSDKFHGNDVSISVNVQPRDIKRESLIASDLNEKLRNFDKMREALEKYVANDECVNTPDAPDWKAGPHADCKWCRGQAVLSRLSTPKEGL